MDASTMNQVVGMDLGDKYSVLCTLDEWGEVVEESKIRTTPAGMAGRFAHLARSRVVLEAGTHSPWVSRQVESYGHEVVVANPRRVALIYRAHTKTDEIDAEVLARLGRVDPALLSPIRHRGTETIADRAVLRSRTAVVRSRSRLIQVVRSVVKSQGLRLPASGTNSFAGKVRDEIPVELQTALSPMVEIIDELTRQIRAYDRAIESIAEEKYPETLILRQVIGVGAVTALAFVLTIENPHRFAKSFPSPPATKAASFLDRGRPSHGSTEGQRRSPPCNATLREKLATERGRVSWRRRRGRRRSRRLGGRLWCHWPRPRSRSGRRGRGRAGRRRSPSC